MITERTFTGADGRDMFFRQAVAAKPRGVVFIVHGFGEHTGRYLETMDRFAARGLSAYAMDLRGFGRNAKVMGHMESLDLVAEDLHLLATLAAGENPGLPVVLLGHSLGGLIALKQLIHHQDDFDLCITSGPALLPPENANKVFLILAGVLARIVPLHAFSPLEANTGTRSPEMKARDDGDDLLYSGGFRAKTGYELLQAQLMLKDRLGEITLPLLALHGGGDLIMNPAATELLVESVGSENKQKIVFPDLYHEVLNEPERDTVFDAIFTWLDERLPLAGR